MKKILFLIWIWLPGLSVAAQRHYAANSVLGSGSWYKLSVKNAGIYKVDVAFLNALGIAATNLSSASIRLYGNGGAMLAENNLELRTDDLEENAVMMLDGGDGIFNGNDYFLFYAPGPHRWIKDSLHQAFSHRKNLYSDVAYYFITIGGTGKRIAISSFSGVANKTIMSYDEHLFHETDTINFLSSGREWFGEEFSNITGNGLGKSFTVDIPGLNTSAPVKLISDVAARTVGATSSIIARVNGQTFSNISVSGISGNFSDAFAVNTQQQNSGLSGLSSLNITYTFVPGNFSAQGWLNWFEIHGRKNLIFSGADQFSFRDWRTVASVSINEFIITNATATAQVWEVTDAMNAVKMNSSVAANVLRFLNDGSRLREYIAFNGNSYLTPVAIGKTDNQNLHNSSVKDYIIITHKSLLAEANRLAAFHTQKYKYNVTVATTEQVFNEFASGSPDPAAIRDFVKMYYDKAGTDTTKRPKYLLLLGDASFDYKTRISNNTNLVPAYQSHNSLDPLSTYTSDDFFGLLDDADDVNLVAPPSLLDIGIGRIPAKNAAEAKNMVDKIINYHSKESFGPWRNELTFAADDEDNNLHLNDAEFISGNAVAVNPRFNPAKIYLDAYRQESGSGGSRYPEVNRAIVNHNFNGNLIFNYSGHGGYQRLADEAVFGTEEALQFNNPYRLPLFITATCDFAPYDDPTKSSIGEFLLMNDSKGAVALLTTTRLVFAYSNRIINNNYLQIALQKDATKGYLTLGESLKRAKNLTYQSFGDYINNRKFTLLGDPAMKLGYPELDLTLTHINNNSISGNDTLKALEKYTFSGEITDASGNFLSNFNGTVYPTVYDKPQEIKTLGNDPSSRTTSFSQQTNIVYKGKATVQNGRFSFSFIVPKDINYQVGNGKLSLYANSDVQDGNGVSTNFKIGSTSSSAIADTEGPDINPYLNDEKFVNGGLSNESPILIVKLSDSSGINTVGTGIGHDITAVLDNDDKNVFVLNDFYEAALNSYQQGTVRFQLIILSEGYHTLKIKAWDVANNSNEVILEFYVAKKEDLKISHVLNYPNPFTTKTQFWFEHNQPFTDLKVLVQVYSITGKIVHQIQQQVNTEGNRVTQIEWDGKDAGNEKVARGVYIYRIIVTNNNGQKATATQKLYVL